VWYSAAERVEIMGMGRRLERLDTSSETGDGEAQPTAQSEATVPQAANGSAKPTRLSVNISRDTLEALQEISSEKEITITEALRRLVGYGIIVYRANRDDKDVLLRRDNKTERIVLVD
jgi:hypothetical protein